MLEETKEGKKKDPTWEKIEAWLEDEGISFAPVPDFNSHYHLAAHLKNVQVQLSEPKVRRGVLAVQAVVSLDDQQAWKARKLRKEDLKALFLSLFERLDREEYLFMLQEDFFQKNWLRIQRTLYVEDLTRTMLLKEMKDLNMRFLNVNYELNAALDNAPKTGAEVEETIYT
jgi:hypothetical protein